MSRTHPRTSSALRAASWITLAAGLALTPFATAHAQSAGPPDAAAQKAQARAQVQNQEASAQEETRLKEEKPTGEPALELGANDAERANQAREDQKRAQALAEEQRMKAAGVDQPHLQDMRSGAPSAAQIAPYSLAPRATPVSATRQGRRAGQPIGVVHRTAHPSEQTN